MYIYVSHNSYLTFYCSYCIKYHYIYYTTLQPFTELTWLAPIILTDLKPVKIEVAKIKLLYTIHHTILFLNISKSQDLLWLPLELNAILYSNLSIKMATFYTCQSDPLCIFTYM